MKTILFPTDFSEGLNNALEYAVSLSIKTGSKLVLHYSYFAMAQESGLNNEVIATLIESAENDGNQQMHKLKEKLLSMYPGLQLDTQVFFGFPIDTISKSANDLNADLIVMGTRGAKNLVDRIAGTVTMGVSDHVTIPILAIPYDYKLTEIKNMLYAITYEENDKNVIDKMLNMAEIFDADVNAIHIIEDFEPQIENASKLMTSFKNHYQKVENLSFKNLKRDDLEDGIDTYVRTHNPDVLVLAHHHRGFWSSLFHTSVTKYFAFKAQLPVLIFPVD